MAIVAVEEAVALCAAITLHRRHARRVVTAAGVPVATILPLRPALHAVMVVVQAVAIIQRVHAKAAPDSALIRARQAVMVNAIVAVRQVVAADVTMHVIAALQCAAMGQKVVAMVADLNVGIIVQRNALMGAISR